MGENIKQDDDTAKTTMLEKLRIFYSKLTFAKKIKFACCCAMRCVCAVNQEQ